MTIMIDNKDSSIAAIPPMRPPSQAEMHAVFSMCRSNRWNSVLNCIRSNHLIPVTSMIMDNHISTTILHQAITSKGDIKARTRVIREILDIAPKAATIKNGYGSLPLHVISQRNTKLDAATKELLIHELVAAYKGALVEQGGVGKRTPLHIIFTDYISPRVTEMMVRNGREACFMKDKKGFLPAHVACSRHCSPEKLHMLLEINPHALTATTKSGETLLSLAMGTATRTHPNYALIDHLKRRLETLGGIDETSAEMLKDEEERRITKFETCDGRRRRGKMMDVPEVTTTVHPSPRMMTTMMSSSNDAEDDDTFSFAQYRVCNKTTTRKRKVTVDEEDMDPATLLLNFSRQTGDKKMKIASV